MVGRVERRSPFHNWSLLSLRVFHFEQTHLNNARQVSRLNRII